MKSQRRYLASECIEMQVTLRKKSGLCVIDGIVFIKGNMRYLKVDCNN